MSQFPFQVISPDEPTKAEIAGLKVEKLCTGKDLQTPDYREKVIQAVKSAFAKFPDRIIRIAIDAEDGISVQYMEELKPCQ